MTEPDILVLGATGRIGGILRRFWPADQARWQTRSPNPPPGWVSVDLIDDQALATAADGCRAIVCLAGVTPLGAGQGGAYDDNTTLALAAVRAGAAVGARVLVTSSAAVYGNQAGLLTETAPLLGVSDYGRAKIDMEQQVAALADRLNVTVCALRIGNVAGVDAILGGWRPGFQLDQFSSGKTPERSYIGPETLARVLFDLVGAPDLPPVLNVAAPGAVEMGALLDAAGLDWAPRPAHESAVASVCLDTRGLQRFTDLELHDSYAETLVAQFRNMKAG